MDPSELEDLKITDQFKLLGWLHGEEFPTAALTKRKNEVADLIADHLAIEKKEVFRMIEAKEKKKETRKDEGGGKRKCSNKLK